MAAARLGVTYVRLERPPWSPAPGECWTNVATIDEAAAVLPSAARILLTIGRKEIAPFIARNDLAGILRMIETPARPVPPSWRLLRARPPFSLEEERRLIVEESITHLVTKNSGGAILRSKLQAAHDLGIAVVMVARPAKPEAPTAATASALVELLLA